MNQRIVCLEDEFLNNLPHRHKGCLRDVQRIRNISATVGGIVACGKECGKERRLCDRTGVGPRSWYRCRGPLPASSTSILIFRRHVAVPRSKKLVYNTFWRRAAAIVIRAPKTILIRV